MKSLTLSDQVLLSVDRCLRTVFGTPKTTSRPYPAENKPHSSLSETERKQIAGLMRVNHTGEVCAQALYQGQALTARTTLIREKMQTCAAEENDHLVWCENRLTELSSHTSVFNIGWYIGSLLIGCAAGLAGDAWSLGFLAETEHQVTEHLKKHTEKIPQHDERTQAILQQMSIDESHHREEALKAGAKELPVFIKKMMSCISKLMTKTVYYI